MSTETPKKRRGRPRKNDISTSDKDSANKSVKKGRGRPKKVASSEKTFAGTTIEALLATASKRRDGSQSTNGEIIEIPDAAVALKNAISDYNPLEEGNSQEILEQRSRNENAEAEASNGTTVRRPRRAASRSPLYAGVRNLAGIVSTANADEEFVLSEADAEAGEEIDDYKETSDAEVDFNDDIDIELENDEEEPKYLKNKTRKTKKARANAKKESTSKGSSPGISKLSSKNRTIRSLKDLSSARDKIERIYGLNREKLLRLAKVKEGFETCLFSFPNEKIQPDSSYSLNIIPPCRKYSVFEKIQKNLQRNFHDIDEKEFDELFKFRVSPLDIVVGDTEIRLKTHEKSDFPVFANSTRKGFFINSGGLVTDMAWLAPNEDDDSQYLAVSISQYLDDPSGERLQGFEKEEHVSCVIIYKITFSTLQISRVQTIVHPFGEIWNLKWHEGYHSKTALGLLGFVCQNGGVKFIEIFASGSDENKFVYYVESALTISLPSTLITCFDFLSPEVIVCGFKNGFVAEFDLSDEKNIPSYYHKVHESYIISISVGYSESENPVVGTISIDGYFCVFDSRDIFTTKCNVGRFRGGNIVPLTYCAPLDSFVFSDQGNSLRCVVPRALFASHQINSRETTVTSAGASRLHPLILSSASDGTLYVDNIARRLLTGVKNVSNTHKSLKLWRWDYDRSTGKYRLDHNYEVFKSTSNDVSKIKIDAPGINISCVKWNESSKGGNFYAFANNAGILTIECLEG
ncbi:hypothetical protein KAFR_0E03950 [Kazachstania africana CBS 2517]|uniref:Uncharacterized protein n=1 Tax=Kazachstania africana (strain ATCC 22294 / BCRC 22015 / CBS 2517 / CECT 1963 / NBRC 1671 / NRRL Y-8276) TaxID=1071382 RepID=H2AVZ6_KAZAF|nr:hypothetical protein KAFR_0E03950 [Kazachstania africana CBS 2517]CCF58546.1 hypothetical protein KAFR_0E03950 [Kazachstania africana CBS 2517]